MALALSELGAELLLRSLDRTNVVQSALGKWVLNNQLRSLGVLSTKESVEEHAAFLSMFRSGESSSLWATAYES